MSQSNGASKLLIVSFVVVAIGAVAGNYALDLQRREGRRAASQINNELRSAEQGLAELREAEAAYLAAGSNEQASAAAMSRATALGTQIENAISNLSALTSSDDARAHYQAAAPLVIDVVANDQKARNMTTSGQALVAADVVLIEGAEPVRKLAAELTLARDIEMAGFENQAVRLGWIGTAGNGALMVIGLLLLIAAGRSRSDDNVDAQPAPIDLPVPTPMTPAAAPAVSESASAGADLNGAAELCVDLGSVSAGNELPALLARAAAVLDAKGLVLWVRDGSGGSLKPSLAHGYSDKVLTKMGVLSADGDNVTSLAFRTRQPQYMTSSGQSRGALAVPLLSADGCVGVLAAEVQQIRGGDARSAVARIIAAQLSTIVGPAVAASGRDQGPTVQSSVHSR